MGGRFGLLGLVLPLRNFPVGFVRCLLHGLAPCFGLFFLGQYNSVVHHDITFEGLADVDVVLVVVMQGERVDFIVREAVAPALLHVIEDKCYTVVDVLLRVGVTGCK